MSDSEIAQYESLLKTLPQTQLITDEDVSNSRNWFMVSFIFYLQSQSRKSIRLLCHCYYKGPVILKVTPIIL